MNLSSQMLGTAVSDVSRRLTLGIAHKTKPITPQPYNALLTFFNQVANSKFVPI